MIVVVHSTTCCLCQQVTNLVVLGTRYLRSWKSLPPPPWSCFPCHRCPGRPPGEVRRSEGVEPGCKLFQLFLLCRLSLSLSKGLLLCHLLICRTNSCTSDSRSRRRRSAWRSEPRILSIPAVCSSFSSGAGVAGMLEVPVTEKGRGLRL